jgi:hypothetical protein
MENSSSFNKIYQATFQRLEVDNDGLVEDSRSIRMIVDKKIFFNNLLFGTQIKSEVRGANLYSIPASYGLIGSLFYYLILIYLVCVFINPLQIFSELNKTLVLLLMNLFHRPELLSFFASLILFSFIILYKKHIYFDRSFNSYSNA